MSTVPDLLAHTGYLLRTVSNAVSHGRARKVAQEGVTVAEWAMLRSLYGGQAYAPASLARKMGMTKGAISKLSDRLLGKGLIVRVSQPNGRRGYSLSLSPAGAKKVPVLARLVDDNDAVFFADLASEDHESLRALLLVLIGTHGLAGSCRTEVAGRPE